MDTLLEKALEAINLRTDSSADLSHSNDRNAAKEMFLRLYLAGEILLAEEIEAWAQNHGWPPRNAEELGALAQHIGMGNEPLISDGPWWKENIIEILSSPA